jgi:hypothetical protein
VYPRCEDTKHALSCEVPKFAHRAQEDCCLPGIKKIEKQIEFDQNRLIRALEPLKGMEIV